MAVLPKNLSMVVQRLANFNRQTVRLRSMSNDEAGPGQTIVFRFPSNTIVDLHNLQLKATLNTTFQAKMLKDACKTGVPLNDAVVFGELVPPRYAQGLFERVDVTVGGTTISGSNVDYGGIYTLLRDALCSSVSKKPFGEMTNSDFDREDRFFNCLHVFYDKDGNPINQGTAGMSSSRFVESAGGNPYAHGDYSGTATTVSSTKVDNPKSFDGCSFAYNAHTPSGLWKSEPIVFQGFLGFLGGKFTRFIDTSITGAIEIRIRLAPLSVCWGPQSCHPGREELPQGCVSKQFVDGSRKGGYYLSDLYMIMDTISFTDDFYRQLLARRLIEGGSIVIPYDNYFSINKFIDAQGDTVSFNVATQSLDYLIGTLRRSDYNVQPSEVGLCEAELCSAANYTNKAEKNKYFKPFNSAGFNANYYNFVSGARNDVTGSGTYQWLVANQLTPTWPADVNDVWLLNQSAFDLANQISDIGNAATHYEFRRGKFAHVTCFAHQAESEKFISGLDTRGASTNMQWMVMGLPAIPEWRFPNGYATKTEGATEVSPTGNCKYNATVWACCTSTLEISAGQNIVVIF